VHYILQSGIFSNDYTVTVISAPVETAITWNTGSGTWNHTTANWLGQNTGLPTPFYNGQNVIFDKTTGGTITIDPNMEPASVIVSAAAGTYTFTGGPISGAGSLAKSGSGSLILSGSNSYTGATTVTGGILKINGSTSASSAFGVSAGAIGGSGTLNGPVTLSGSGGINLYDGATGTLTLGGSLDITGDAGSNTLWFDLGNNTAATDKIAVTGAVSISNPVTIGLKQLGWPSSRVTAGTYDLLSTTSGTLPAIGNFILPITKTFGQTFSLALDGTSQKLQLTAAQAATGPAAAFWSGATDANWSTATNWNTDATSNITASGAPSYNTNVTFYTTTPAAANLTTTLDADFDINTLTFSTDATSPVTLSGATKTLTLEGSGGITVNTPTSGTVTHTIDSKVALAASQTWTVNPNATLTVSGAVTDLTGSANFTKAGTGTLYLNGATTLGGYMTVGVGAAAGSVVVGSGGSLSVGSGSSQYLYVGVNSGGTGILDASLSSGVNANVGNFYVGTGSSGGTGTLNLGANNTITASALFGVGTALWDSTTGTLTTANSSTTTIHTPTMSIGYGNSGNGTESGTGTITLGTGASFIVDGLVSGNGSGRTTMNIGYDTEQYGRSSSGIVNLSAGTASLTLNSLLVAWQTGNGSTPGTLTFGTSGSNHFDVSGTGNVVQIGYLGLFGGGGSGAGTGTVTLANLDASSAVTSTDNNTAILLGNRVAGASGSTTGTLNLIGGSLTITTGGTAIGTAGSGGASYLYIDGTTLKAGATSTTWIQGLTTAKIKAGGVGFNSNGYNITVAQNLLEDTGSTGGGLTKSGAGTLTLTGSNTYTGLTTVSNGTLALGATASLTTSGVTVAAGAVFNTTAQAPFVIPEALPVTLHLTGADAGSSGRITATELDITHANVTLTLDGDLDDNVYILADYTTLTGTGFLTVTTVTGYSIDYAYNGGTQIALVADIAPGYDIWANTNITLIDGLADATTTGDPDGDGSNNLAEYAFGGDPLSGSDNGKVFSQFKLRELSPNGTELILTVAVLTDTSATFVLDGNTLIGTSIAGGITYRIEGSNDLNFSNVQVGQVTPEPTSAMLNVLPTGYAYRSFVLAPGGTPAKGFLRAVVVKPD
jgi:autotransporter-associated beta strand protein